MEGGVYLLNPKVWFLLLNNMVLFKNFTFHLFFKSNFLKIWFCLSGGTKSPILIVEIKVNVIREVRAESYAR